MFSRGSGLISALHHFQPLRSAAVAVSLVTITSCDHAFQILHPVPAQRSPVVVGLAHLFRFRLKGNKNGDKVSLACSPLHVLEVRYGRCRG